MYKPVKIVSGGQTGADEGALIAAKVLGMMTGGWMPRGFLTELGPRPRFAELYGLQEHGSSDYPPRTRQNVFDSQATVWVDGPWPITDTRGFLCTMRYVRLYRKPCLRNPTARELRVFVHDHNIHTLNVAGSRESKRPGIKDYTTSLLMEAFGDE